MGNHLKSFAVLLLVVLPICAACGTTIAPTSVASSTPTGSEAVTPTAPLSTHAGPLLRATLPPTWTETPTLLPTLTLTATPVTPTPTLTPVPRLAELCDSFTVSYEFQDGHTFLSSDTLTMFFGTPLSAVINPATGNPVSLTVRFLATRQPGGENVGVQMEGGQVFGMELPLSRLPLPGNYRWQVAVYGDGIGEQCRHEGSFSVRLATADMTATALATAEATVEATTESGE